MMMRVTCMRRNTLFFIVLASALLSSATLADCASDFATLQNQCGNGSCGCLWSSANPAGGGEGTISSYSELQSSGATCVAYCNATLIGGGTTFYSNGTCSWMQGNTNAITCGVFNSGAKAGTK